MQNNYIEQVSIFIPTHNRHSLLEKNLAWLSKSGYCIYIADSSSSSFEATVKKYQLEGSSRIYYYHFPNANYYEKISYVLSLVATRYIVMCPDDDYIIWKNIPFFVEAAIDQKLKTVVGTELSYSYSKTEFLVNESCAYRKHAIIHQENFLKHLRAGMNPIVCTYYQFHETSAIQHLWSHITSNKYLLPGNKLVEVLFRSGCFINGPVGYVNKILRVLSDTPSLRSYDQSPSVQEYTLNFWDEVNLLKQKEQLSSYLTIISDYIESCQSINSSDALKIAKNIILEPMLRRMHSRHEILWHQRYSLSFDYSSTQDKLIRTEDSIIYKFSMINSKYRLPEVFQNLSSYVLRDSNEWNLFTELLNFLNTPTPD